MQGSDQVLDEKRPGAAYAEGASGLQAWFASLEGQGLKGAMNEFAKPARKTRADALRNRDRVLEAAKLVFSAGGPDASLEAIARQAAVGIGTLYRHFPTREALFEAVYRREVQQLADLATALRSDADPVEALRRWMGSMVEFVATKKGMSAALAVAGQTSSDLVASTFDTLSCAAGTLLDRAVATGAVRDDIGPEDLLRTLVGMCYTHDKAGWQANVLRLVDVFIDGLRRPPRTSHQPHAGGAGHG